MTRNIRYKKRHGNKPCKLFLYDVTSSYFEGLENELANFGYNRDKKRGKMQIVVGMLCDDDGVPVRYDSCCKRKSPPTAPPLPSAVGHPAAETTLAQLPSALAEHEYTILMPLYQNLWVKTGSGSFPSA